MTQRFRSSKAAPPPGAPFWGRPRDGLVPDGLVVRASNGLCRGVGPLHRMVYAVERERLFIRRVTKE
jgi:hypothetical protein